MAEGTFSNITSHLLTYHLICLGGRKKKQLILDSIHQPKTFYCISLADKQWRSRILLQCQFYLYRSHTTHKGPLVKGSCEPARQFSHNTNLSKDFDEMAGLYEPCHARYVINER